MKIGLDLAGWKKIPFDSAIHVKGNNIKKVFVSIDVTPADISLAKNLGCDCVLTHHPIGKSLLSYHKVFLKSHSLIYNDAISTSQLLNMPLLNIHQPLDEYMRKIILSKLHNSKLESI